MLFIADGWIFHYPVASFIIFFTLWNIRIVSYIADNAIMDNSPKSTLDRGKLPHWLSLEVQNVTRGVLLAVFFHVQCKTYSQKNKTLFQLSSGPTPWLVLPPGWYIPISVQLSWNAKSFPLQWTTDWWTTQLCTCFCTVVSLCAWWVWCTYKMSAAASLY